MKITTLLFVFVSLVNFYHVNCADCPIKGINMNTTNLQPATYYGVQVITTFDQSGMATPRLYNFEGSIIAPETGSYTLQLQFGTYSVADLRIDGTDSNCVFMLDTCDTYAAQRNCTIQKTMAANYFYRVSARMQNVCGSNPYIRLAWKKSTETAFTVIPNQYLCTLPFDSNTMYTPPTTASTSSTSSATSSLTSSITSSVTSSTISSVATSSSSDVTSTSSSTSSSSSVSTTSTGTTGSATDTSGSATNSSATVTSGSTSSSAVSSSSTVTTNNSTTEDTGFDQNGVEKSTKSSSSGNSLLLPILVSVFGVILLAVVVIAVILVRRYRNKPNSSTNIELAPRAKRVLKDVVIKESIGRGAFGEVYRGTWQGSVQVALKTLRVEAQTSEFEKEIQILEGIRHPAVVTFYGIYIDQEKTYMVVELCSLGGADAMVQNGEFGENQLLSIAIDVASGMNYLHQMSIIHADLALRNILLTKKETEGEYQAKISDFGMSKILYDNSYYKTSDTTKGVPVRWSPPEVIEYGKFTSASDTWSFGVLLWELFNRAKTPYGGWSNQQVIDKVLAGEKLAVAEAPQEVYEIMEKCWERDAKNRPAMSLLCEKLTALYERKIGRKRNITAKSNVGTNYVTVEGQYH